MAEGKNVDFAVLIPVPVEEFKSIGSAYNEAKRREEHGIWRGINKILAVTEKISCVGGEIKEEKEEKVILAFEYSRCPFSPKSETFMENIRTIESFQSGRDVICIVEKIFILPEKKVKT
ncbi:MAG: hypothetical protein NTZ84_00470 [Candidatus Nealsonbacteria bacterium]|nr:hypothetical protein [Candidatus Nealsonbacteria bacterium]